MNELGPYGSVQAKKIEVIFPNKAIVYTVLFIMEKWGVTLTYVSLQSNKFLLTHGTGLEIQIRDGRAGSTWPILAFGPRRTAFLWCIQKQRLLPSFIEAQPTESWIFADYSSAICNTAIWLWRTSKNQVQTIYLPRT